MMQQSCGDMQHGRRRGRPWRVATAVVACTALLVPTLSGPANASSVTTITFDLASPQYTKAFDAIGALASRSIGVNWKINAFSNFSEYQALIKASATSGDKPGVFQWDAGSELQPLASSHLLAPTTNIWTADVANGSLAASTESFYKVNGTLYCVPFSVDYWGMWYNKAIFAKYHITVPTTWQQLMNDAAILKAHGVTPFDESDDLWAWVWFQDILGSMDPVAYAQLVAGKLPFTAAPVQETMKLWASMIKKGYMSNPTVLTYQQYLLKGGQVAMVPFGSWFVGSLTSIKASLSDYGFFMIPNVNPALKKTVTFEETAPLCASAGTSTTSDALKMLRFLDGAPAQRIWVKDVGDISANQTVKAPPVFASLETELHSGKLDVLGRYYDVMPASVVTASESEFSAFEVHPGSWMSVLEALQKDNVAAGR